MDGLLADGSRCGEDRRDRFAGAQPDRSVQAVAGLGGRIDSEALGDGRGKIGRSVGAAGGIGADLVGTADRLASLNASPGKGGREDGCPAAQDLTMMVNRAGPPGAGQFTVSRCPVWRRVHRPAMRFGEVPPRCWLRPWSAASRSSHFGRQPSLQDRNACGSGSRPRPL